MHNRISFLRISVSVFLIFSFGFSSAQNQGVNSSPKTDLLFHSTLNGFSLYETDHVLWKSDADFQKTFENSGFDFVLLDDERDVKEMSTRERIIFGGYLGLQIGNLITSVNISPTIGYLITNRLTAGLGGTYQYYRDRGWGSSVDFSTSTHIYGGSVYTRYLVFRQIFAHLEFEALNLDSQMGFSPATGANPNDERYWEYNYFAGGGYRAPLGPKVFLNLMVLYNFNTSSVVYYQNPVFRFGVEVRM
ncbi:MAG: hypothetical protein ACOCUQ_02485 [Bacteroidota bacterium]